MIGGEDSAFFAVLALALGFGVGTEWREQRLPERSIGLPWKGVRVEVHGGVIGEDKVGCKVC